MEEGVRALRRAYAGGINYFDLAAGDGSSFPIYGEALHDVRKNIFFQIHFGTDYAAGTYGWTLNPDRIRRSVVRQLSELKTDYIDYDFIHCQDEVKDWETYQKNGVYDYILSLKRQGIVRHIGLSSHTIQKILDDADVDERATVFRRCEKEGIGISVMKPFSGGQIALYALTAHQNERQQTSGSAAFFQYSYAAFATVFLLPSRGSSSVYFFIFEAA